MRSSSSSIVSPPPLSPGEKPSRHGTSYSKRKSSSGTSDRKSKPPISSRRSTPQSTSKTSGGGRPSREKEREDEDRGLVGESFPQFWYLLTPRYAKPPCHVLMLTRYNSTYCEKQINSSSTSFLYCSEAYVSPLLVSNMQFIQSLTYVTNCSCRKHDLPSSGHSHQTSLSNSPTSPSFPSPTSYSSYVRPLSTINPTTTDRDIIPRASPTTLRPRSYFASEPFPGTKAAPIPPSRPSTNSSSSALTSLRELSAALENTRADMRDGRGSLASPAIPRPSTGSGSDADGEDGEAESAQTSGTTSPMSRSASGVWSYMTFAGSASNTAGAMPPLKQTARSYTTPQSTRSTSNSHYAYGTYAGAGTGGSGKAGYGYGGYMHGSKDTSKYRYAPATYTAPLVAAASGLVGMERPLPPRSGGYSHRPRSIDLVTPYSLGYGG